MFLEIGVILVAAAVTGGIYHLTSPVGFFASAQNTESIRDAHSTDFISELDLAEVHDLLAERNTVIIDTRLTPDFEAGHLPGAISVPVDMGDIQRREQLSHVSKDAPIVLYCQSRNCPFSGTVAKRLLADGYYNLRLFPGGWTEWDANRDHVAMAAKTSR
jgi:rhodanese-related sulfurtransferase